MEDYQINYQEYNAAIEKILADKTYNPDHHSQLPWHRLRGYIIRRIFDILKTEFSQPIHSFRIRNPFLSSSTSAISNNNNGGNDHNGDDKPQSGQMETAAQMAARLGQYLEAQFPKSPPFTIYRIAELLSAPVRYCKDTEPHKWLAALESVIWVQSAINEFPPVIVMGGDGDNAGSNTENDTGGKDRRNGVYDSNAKRENNSTGTSTSGGGDTGPQTIEMEEISWITEEHLRQIELDQHREHEEEEEEGEEEHFEELKNENAIEYEKTTDVDSLATHTVAGADSYRSGNETAEAITARDTGAEPPALAKEDSGNEKSIPTTSSSSSSSSSANSAGKQSVDDAAVQGANPDDKAHSGHEASEQKKKKKKKRTPPSSDGQTLVSSSQELGHSGAQDDANMSADERSETHDNKNKSHNDESQNRGEEVDAGTRQRQEEEEKEEEEEEENDETVANRSVEDVDMVDSTD